MSSDATKNSPAWKELLEAAFLEFDNAKLLQRIATARSTILQRLEEWRDGQQRDEEEQLALRNALSTLRTLENMSRRDSTGS
jgi:predicted outer membrane protein